MTPEISLYWRILVHGLAEFHGLNHLTVGKTKARRQMIISPLDILKEPLGTFQPLPPHICAFGICLSFDPLMPEFEIYRAFAEISVRSVLPSPRYILSRHGLMVSITSGMYIEYLNLEDAAIAIVAFNNQSINGHRIHADFALNHMISEDDLSEHVFCSQSSYWLLSSFVHLGTSVESFFLNEQPQLPQDLPLPLPSLCNHERLPLPAQCNHEAFSVASSGLSLVSSWLSKRDSQYSASSSTSKRRRRQPQMKDGYECPDDDCRKLFDRACDRDKHWHNVHGEKQYICPVCFEGFVYKKDLNRHMDSHKRSDPNLSLSDAATNIFDPKMTDHSAEALKGESSISLAQV